MGFKPRRYRKTTCSRCGEPLENKKQSHCRSCRATYMRGYRSNQKQVIEEALAFYKQHHG